MFIFSIFNRTPYASEADKAWDDSPLQPETPTGVTKQAKSAVVKPFIIERLPLDTRIAEVHVKLEAFEQSLQNRNLIS